MTHHMWRPAVSWRFEVRFLAVQFANISFFLCGEGGWRGREIRFEVHVVECCRSSLLGPDSLVRHLTS